MEVRDVRSYERSCHSQDQLMLTHLTEEELQDQARPYIRQLSKNTQKELSDGHLSNLDHHNHSQDDNHFNMFDRAPILQKQPQKRSLIVAQRVPRSFVRVYFFQGKRFRDYYNGDFQIGCTIGEFIKIAVEDYCEFFLQFRADIISIRTFELKLADLSNRHDPIVEELDPCDQLEAYFGCSLCLLRRSNRQSNLKMIQQRLKESAEVFQVSIPFQNGNRMFEVERNRNFGTLTQKIFKACDIIESPTDFLLVEYNKFLVYEKETPIEEVHQRDFQLLRAKKDHYTDESDQADNEKRRSEPERPALTPCLLAQLHHNEPLREIFTTEVQTNFYESKMTLSIENCVFVERYSKCLISQLMELVCQQEYQKRYPLTALMSAYAEKSDLVLVFLVRDRHLIKRYRMPEHKQVLFLSEVLRLCRVYRKNLTPPNTRQ